MSYCRNVTIRLKEEEDLYKEFNQAKAKYDAQRKERGERRTSCAEFAKILIHRALKEEES